MLQCKYQSNRQCKPHSSHAIAIISSTEVPRDMTIAASFQAQLDQTNSTSNTNTETFFLSTCARGIDLTRVSPVSPSQSRDQSIAIHGGRGLGAVPPPPPLVHLDDNALLLARNARHSASAIIVITSDPSRALVARRQELGIRDYQIDEWIHAVTLNHEKGTPIVVVNAGHSAYDATIPRSFVPLSSPAKDVWESLMNAAVAVVEKDSGDAVSIVAEYFGNVKLQLVLGDRKMNARPLDVVQAVRLYRMAANAGSSEGQRKYAKLLAEGKGVEKNIVEAAKYFKMAAEAGDSFAQLALAKWCARGNEAVPKNLLETKRYLELSAKSESSEDRAFSQDLLKQLEKNPNGPLCLSNHSGEHEIMILYSQEAGDARVSSILRDKLGSHNLAVYTDQSCGE
ncbi:hypothetical protein HDU99_000320, partial [Rhizoclosmatium hyalinum]